MQLTTAKTATAQAITTVTQSAAVEHTTAAIRQVVTTLTNPTAIALYRAVYQAVITTALLTIALGMATRDLWETIQAQGGVQASFKLYRQRTYQRFTVYKTQTLTALSAWVAAQVTKANRQIDQSVATPARDLKGRIAAAKSALIHKA